MNRKKMFTVVAIMAVVFMLSLSACERSMVVVTPEPVVSTPTNVGFRISNKVVEAAVVDPVVMSETIQSEDWVVTWYDGADLDRGNLTTFRDDAKNWQWRKIQPELWPTFPNEPNPLVPEFRVVNTNEVPDGVENAMDESNFCQQVADEECRFPVAAQHYMSFTGDYRWNVFECAENGSRIGCNLVIVNVGGVSSDFTAYFGQGFRLHARYFNGEAMGMAMWALTSNTANYMLNLESNLNPKPLTNAGANCSVPEACLGVDTTIVFVSGNEILMSLHTVTMK